MWKDVIQWMWLIQKVKCSRWLKSSLVRANLIRHCGTLSCVPDINPISPHCTSPSFDNQNCQMWYMSQGVVLMLGNECWRSCSLTGSWTVNKDARRQRLDRRDRTLVSLKASSRHSRKGICYALEGERATSHVRSGVGWPLAVSPTRPGVAGRRWES